MNSDLSAGFADPVAGAQSCFRAVLDAMAHPGRLQTVGGVRAPAPLFDATAAVLLTLVDQETPLWIDPAAMAAGPWIAFHTGAAQVALTHAMFVLAMAMPDLTALAKGSDEMPERSATVILQVSAFDTGQRFKLQGPGLRVPGDLRVAGLPAGFAATWQANRAMFPCGVDLILCAGDRLTALPRSVTVEER